MPLRNLNFFLAAFVLIFVTCGSFITLVGITPIALIGHAIGGIKSPWLNYFPMVFPSIIIGGILGMIWWRKGLSPRVAAEGKERRYRIGHCLMLAFNISVLCLILSPILIPIITGKTEDRLYVFFLMPIVFLAGIGGGAGLYMVRTSRA